MGKIAWKEKATVKQKFEKLHFNYKKYCLCNFYKLNEEFSMHSLKCK